MSFNKVFTGDVLNAGGGTALAFRSFSAKSVLANATNGSAVPTELAGSAAFQHLRVNSANNALEWSILTTGDFPNNSVPLTALATISTDTLLANITAGTATPTAVAFTTIDSTSIIWDAGTHTFQLGAASGGDITRSQNSLTYTINNDAVTYAKIQNVSATSRFLGRFTAGAGDIEELTGNQAGEIIRWSSRQTIDLVAGATSTLTVTSGVTYVYITINGTGDVVIDEIIYGSSNSGARLIIANNEAASGRVILRNNATKAGNQINTPGDLDVVLPTALSSCEVAHNGLSWVLELNTQTLIRKNSTGTEFSRRRVNLIEGTGITLTVADDATDNETDITIASSSGAAGHGIRDNGTLETQRANLNFVTSASITAVCTDDSGNNETEATFQLVALSGAVTSSANSTVTAFGALAAKSVLANATNASAVPAALAGSAAFQHLRVNSANNALEWSVLTTGDFPNNSVPLTGLATIATDTLLANITAGTATPVAVAFTSIDSTSLIWDATSHTFQRAALTGDVTASQNSNATTIANDAVTNAKLANMTVGTVKGRAIDAGSTGDPQDLTGLQVGALIRFGGNESLSLAPGTHNNLAVAATTSILYVSPNASGDVDITGIALGSSNSGGSLWIIKPTATGRVRLMHSVGTSSFNNQFLCPGAVIYTLTSVDDAVHISNEGAGQWRVNGRVLQPGETGTTQLADNAVTDTKIRQSAGFSVLGRAASSTGDIADITATAPGDNGFALKLNNAGTSLDFGSIDTIGITNDAVTNAKLANMAQSTIKGRAEGAGTGDPTDLSAAQVVAIIEAASPVWTKSWSEDFEVFFPAAGLGAVGVQCCGSTNWVRTTGIAGGVTGGAGLIDPVAGHPGIVRLGTEASDNQKHCLHRGALETTAFIRGDQILEFNAVVRVPTVTSVGFFIGFSENPSSMLITGTGNSHIMGFLFDTDATDGSINDTTIHCITRESDGTATNTDSNITLVANEWNKYTIRQTTVGTVEFLIDDAVVATHSTQVPDSEFMNCGFTLVNRSAAVREIDIDYVDCTYQTLTRTS